MDRSGPSLSESRAQTSLVVVIVETAPADLSKGAVFYLAIIP